MMYKQGTKIRVITVANNTPHANEMAIGRKGAVAGVLVDISGINPTKVVTEVRMMGRKRIVAAARMAFMAFMPVSRCRLA